MSDDREAAAVHLPDDAGATPWLVVYLKGVAMGAADAVPGVSGGTIALITGIYDRLVGAIASLDPTAVADPLLRPGESRSRELGAALVAMDVPFLAVLGLGIATGVATVSQGLEYALSEQQLATYAFFFGLIAASAVVLYGAVSLSTPGRVLVAAAGVVLAFLLVGEFRAALGHGPAVVFASGVVAVSAMLLPGVSGSFLLLALGQLEYMASRLNAFLEAVAGLAAGGDLAAVAGPGGVVGTFLAGAAVGLVSVAHVVRYALRRNRPATLTFLVSLMVGALRLPAARVVESAGGDPAAYAVALVAAAVGAALVVGLERLTGGIGFG